MLRWYRRGAALITAALAGVLIPAVAWAHTAPVAVAVGDELARRRYGSRGLGVFGLLGTMCCLLVVAVIVLVVVLVTRRMRRR